MKFEDNYAFLSNMFPCNIKYNGYEFPCVETGFQFAKCVCDEDRYKFFVNGKLVDGYAARKIGRALSKIREDWDIMRIDIMYALLEDKFYNHPDLRQQLKDTGNVYLVEENTWGDKFWGVCDGEGSNLLGKMIMEIRHNIQDEEREAKKIIVAGSRSFNNYKLLCEKLDYYFANVTPVIVCGEARGADALGKQYAHDHNLSVSSFPAHWELGKNAGYLRNEQMAKVADCLIAFWDGKSKGTEHIIKTMRQLNKPVRIVRF